MADEVSIDNVVREDGRYPLEAFEFLHEGLNRAVKTVHGEKDVPKASRHVTGQQLCLAMRDVALDRWGLLARQVLSKWNIRATDDFGEMVYLLIRHDLMKKTEQDSIADFHAVYDFAQAFKYHDDFEIKE